nr:putative inactive receptor kinase [Quercus suber]
MEVDSLSLQLGRSRVRIVADQSFVRLPGVGLVGPIPPNTLGRLSQLRVLSLRANRLSGEIPSDFSKF